MYIPVTGTIICERWNEYNMFPLGIKWVGPTVTDSVVYICLASETYELLISFTKPSCLVNWLLWLAYFIVEVEIDIDTPTQYLQTMNVYGRVDKITYRVCL